MKTLSIVLLCLLPLGVLAQKKALEEQERARGAELQKTAGVPDRAGGLINKGNIGQFFENRGKLYARRVTDGPSGEYPIGSKRDMIYRVNPFIGTPRNVVQGRYTTNEEWEAVGGYHNRTGARVAFSDRPASWPANGWPVKDGAGNNIIRSDQDSYCVYSDSNNTKGMMGLLVAQTTYTYGVKFARDIIFYKFQITTKGTRRLDSLYFAMYLDFDIGNVSGGVPEYEDDIADFNKELELAYSYDSDNYSSEWPGAPPGYMGFAFLRTPLVNGKQLGVTDWHYGLYYDDVDIDTVQYGIMASTPGLYNAPLLSPRYFHLGANAPNLHFDDPKTIPPTGLDILALASSGPYTLNPGDTLTFILAQVAGVSRDELFASTRMAKKIEGLGFVVARPPDPPKLSATAGDRRVTLYWDNRSELSRDRFTNKFDFEGYKLYRSNDKGATWDQIDRNAVKTAGPDPVPIAQFDRINSLGKNTGLQYSFTDTTVINGIEYWYSLTAYDKGDSTMESLETSIGSSLEVTNIVSVVPRQDAVGRSLPSAGSLTQSGTGDSDFRFVVAPTDQPGVGGKTYTIDVVPLARVERGNLSTTVRAAVAAPGQALAKDYAVIFTSDSTFDVVEVPGGAVVQGRKTYFSGATVNVGGLSVIFSDDDPTVPRDFKPEAGDSILISRAIRVMSGSDTVMSPRKYQLAKPYATTNGIVLTVTLPAGASKPLTYRDKFSFTVSASSVDRQAADEGLSKIRVVPNPYVVSSKFEEEFGALRREPIRQLKFIHLPSECTIDIFTLDGDLLQTIRHSSTNGVESWDMRTSAGREISAGVYIYLVRTQTAERLDRFAVIK